MAGPEDETNKKDDNIVDDDAVQDAVQLAMTDEEKAGVLPKKRRLCRYPGCTKVIKSQGHCQRHGARAKRCKVEGCDKQAQGTHDGMCKRHWKAVHFPPPPPKPEDQPPPPEGESVYDTVLPISISYRPTTNKVKAVKDDDKVDPLDPPPAPEGTSVMPLVSFLRDGSAKEPGWHRNGERRARGMFPVSSLSSQLEPWERQLALVEILLLSGGTPYANFKDLSHAWGREKGFHHLLATSVCERRGEVERKKRSDAGRQMTPEQRQVFRDKLKRARTSKDGEEEDDEEDQQQQQQHEHHDENDEVAAAAAVVNIDLKPVQIEDAFAEDEAPPPAAAADDATMENAG
eukprot:CAMPEP_0119017766 /NCGR_PEP_ID=MMETSP1176-20130426/17606_1 /TAXON_ID=265551 /ORGANISM="Synedropsis recta cf, Strain CCMP1620" /LENGTH=344 /DNA_ID=CAMNT_0006971589 /DNA_START=20 /DNA_END=1051 /DNA_ORIENTATION=-